MAENKSSRNDATIINTIAMPSKNSSSTGLSGREGVMAYTLRLKSWTTTIQRLKSIATRVLHRERSIVMIGSTPSKRYTREVAIAGLQLCREILRLDGTNYTMRSRVHWADRISRKCGRAIWQGGAVPVRVPSGSGHKRLSSSPQGYGHAIRKPKRLIELPIARRSGQPLANCVRYPVARWSRRSRATVRLSLFGRKYSQYMKKTGGHQTS